MMAEAWTNMAEAWTNMAKAWSNMAQAWSNMAQDWPNTAEAILCTTGFSQLLCLWVHGGLGLHELSVHLP